MDTSKRAVKRISKDIANIVKNDSLKHQERIHCIFNDDDIYDVKALIVGPADTPYEGGFYFFSLRFPENYPQKPPTALMKTLGTNIRFNPNLYEEGKVCLSILGTWSGPNWTVCMSMTTVLCSIQSLMSEMPYRNEPGHENDPDKLCNQYNDCINFHNFRISIIGMLEKPASGFEEFLPIIEKTFVLDYSKHKKRIKELKKKMKGKTVTAPAPFTNMTALCDYESLEKKMDELYKKLSPKYPSEIITEPEQKIESSDAKSDSNDTPKSSLIKKILAHKTVLFG